MRTSRQIWQDLIRLFRRPAATGATESRGTSAAASSVNTALLEDVAGLQSGLEQLSQRDGQQLEDLRRRVSQLESERDIARQDVEGLRHALADAVSRQEKTEIHASTLEIRFREQDEKHQADLQEALIRERRQNRRLQLATVMAVAALVLGGALSVTIFRMVENNASLLATVNEGLRGIQASIDQYQSDTRNELARATASFASRMLPPADTAERTASDGTTIEQPVDTSPLLPEPDFAATGSLPPGDHDFGSRRDVRSFFAENARQPGVITLPSGLQYKVLIPGNGRMPGASDTVLIEYRAFRPDGTELDNSFSETQPSSFVVSEAIPGLREALQLMQEGAQWELYIPPALVSHGVRKRGRFDFEPLIYTVELLSVVSEHAATQEH